MNFAVNQIIGLAGFCLLMSFGLAGCHSSDMGDAAPDRVPMDTALADWDHGAGMIIQQKCANCHTDKRSQAVPGNTPHSLDGIASASFFTDRKNHSLIKAMKIRVEADVNVNSSAMPPRFATPLYPEEREGLLSCLDQFLNSMDAEPAKKPDPTPTPTPTPTPKPGEPTPTPRPKLTFENVKPIVKESCGKSGCHDSDGYPVLESREDFVKNKADIIDALNTRYMPKNNPTFLDTDAGKTLMEWLSGDLAE